MTGQPQDRDEMTGAELLPLTFRSKLDTSGDCWLWQAGTGAGGYGRYWTVDRRFVQAHRFAYEQLRGSIPAGLVLDHLCRVPGCVNPAHLEPVTHAENTRRGAKGVLVTSCKNGHPYTPENTYIKPNGCRDCRTCREDRRRRNRERSTAA